MKKVVNLTMVIAVLILGLISCESEEKREEINGHYIDLAVDGIEDGTSVKILNFGDVKEAGQQILVDSTTFQNGIAKLQTKTKDLKFYHIIIDDKKTAPIVMFLDKDCDIVKFKGSADSFTENYTVEGSQYSGDFKAYLDFQLPYTKQKMALGTDLQNAMQTNDSITAVTLMAKFDELDAATQKYSKDYITEHPESPVSIMMLGEFHPSATGLERFDMKTLDFYDNISKAMKEKYPNSDYPDMIGSEGKQLRSQIEMALNPTSQTVPDIIMNDENGKEVKLSDLRGQIVLIDFWASWCGPCRRENPNVVANYEKYKDQGFTVFSVSLDSDKDKWLAAIKSDNLSWKNHVSSLQKWETKAVADYGVTGIPASFLIDENGVLIARDLREGALGEKLAQVFNK